MERAARSQRHPAGAMQLLRPTPRSSMQQSRRRALEHRQARTVGRLFGISMCWIEHCSWSMSHRWLCNCAWASTRAVSDARGEQWLIARVSQAVGTAGLVSGQSRDLVERKGGLDSDGMARINQQKTGVLFELAVVGGGMILDLPDERLEALNLYAGHVGQAFQSADDLLDCREHSKHSGKDCGADVDKAGSVHQLGETALRERLQGELARADRRLAQLGLDRSLLRAFVLSLFQRLV